MAEHIPVLVEPLLELLNVQPDRVFLDCTLGLGGHAGAIARRLTSGFVIACDRDEDSIAKARQATADCAGRIRYRQARFSQLRQVLEEEGVRKVWGLVADLGVSRYQLTDPERGFSFQSEGPLDMRMSRSQEGTAADIVNFWSERDICALLEQGEESSKSNPAGTAIPNHGGLGQGHPRGCPAHRKNPSRDGRFSDLAQGSESGTRGTRSAVEGGSGSGRDRWPYRNHIVSFVGRQAS
jgi:16S rRNA (cytosine(1402)-N(4))-methyltransferase